MPSLFSLPALARRRFWRMLSVLFALCWLTACQPPASAPATAPDGAAPPASASPAPEPPKPGASPPPETEIPKAVPKNGARPPTASAKPPAAANGSGPVAGEAPRSIPRFSWPPPKASAQEAIPDKWLRTGRAPTLASVADKFEKALKLAGYTQRSYYEVPRGFVLATQIEHIRADGSPLPGEDRWTVGTPRLSSLSLLAFIEALAHAPAGIYRAIVFVVTDAPWVQAPTPPSKAEIEAWTGGGASALPAYIGSLPYGDDYHAQALIYEFRKGDSGPAETVLPSAVAGEVHLDRGGIWKPLSIL